MDPQGFGPCGVEGLELLDSGRGNRVHGSLKSKLTEGHSFFYMFRASWKTDFEDDIIEISSKHLTFRAVMTVVISAIDEIINLLV